MRTIWRGIKSLGVLKEKSIQVTWRNEEQVTGTRNENIFNSAFAEGFYGGANV